MKHKKLMFILLPILLIIVLIVLIIIKRTTPSRESDYIGLSGGGGDAVHYIPRQLFDIYEKAIKTNDPNICYQIGDENNNMGPNRVSCITDIATKNRNKKICIEYLKEEKNIGYCIRAYALVVKDEKVCSEITYGFDRYGCIDNIMDAKAKETNDLSYCLKAQSQTYRYGCIQRYAKSKEQCKLYLKQIFMENPSHPAFNYEDVLNDCPERK